MTNMELKQVIDISALREWMQKGARPTDILAKVLDGVVVDGGLWRFYSSGFPPGGSATWNNAEWRTHWPAIRSDCSFWGEDAFGNQLAMLTASPNCFIWSHEDGALVDTDLDVTSILECVASDGLDWIDFYGDGSLKVARACRDLINPNSHLHWTMPLILGGLVSAENITVVERNAHLAGHGQLWAQVGGLPPGTEVVFR